MVCEKLYLPHVQTVLIFDVPDKNYIKYKQVNKNLENLQIIQLAYGEAFVGRFSLSSREIKWK